MATGFDALAAAGVQSGLEQNQHSRQLQDEQRQQNLQRNWGILNDPSATPELKQAAGQDIQNQYPTPAHKGTFLSDILHIHSKQPSAQPIAPAPPTSSPNPISGAASAPDQGGKDELGVPFSFGAPPTSAASSPDSTGPPSPSSPPAPTPPAATPNLSSVAAAQTPQDAMNLWKQYRGPIAVNEDIAQQRAKAAAGYAQSLEAQRAQAAQDLARTRGNLGIGITPENRFLNQYAAQHGYGSAAEMNADETGEAMKAYRASNATPGWKSITDGNEVYAIDSHNPNGTRQLIGHKNDLTERQEFRTVTYPDGSSAIVPVTVWTKKGSSTPVLETQGDQVGGAPVSASTPQGPGSASTPPTTSAKPSGTSPSPAATPQSGAPVSSETPQGVPGSSAFPSNPGARQPGTKPAGGAVKPPSRIPSPTVGSPIAMGGKPSELLKSDTSQYTKIAEDANAKQEALQLAQTAARSPSPSSDQQLIYSWVRANVQGAGRMTQQEFNQASRIGSFGQKVDNWMSLASSGKMSPEIRQMLLTDIRGAATNSMQQAQTARDQVQQDMTPGRNPTSSKTPGGPGAWAAPKDAPAPTKPNQVLKSNGQVVARSIDGKTWSQP